MEWCLVIVLIVVSWIAGELIRPRPPKRVESMTIEEAEILDRIKYCAGEAEVGELMKELEAVRNPPAPEPVEKNWYRRPVDDKNPYRVEG